MAYNQAPSRIPLIDNSLKEALQRRGTEILGLILIAISIGIFLLLWSYSPNDRSFWSISDEPTQNILGVIGSSMLRSFLRDNTNKKKKKRRKRTREKTERVKERERRRESINKKR